ncbi:MAG: hypothetical protein JW709_06485, partial [Sedimentisphaerales bacterium]|nr:hypothetical protein [Sedimentisphaerales bacterium]
DERISYGAVMMSYRDWNNKKARHVPWSIPPFSSVDDGKIMRTSQVPSPSEKVTIWDSNGYMFSQSDGYGVVLYAAEHFLSNPAYQSEVFNHVFRHNLRNLNHGTNDNIGPNALFLDGHVQRNASLFSFRENNFSW